VSAESVATETSGPPAHRGMIVGTLILASVLQTLDTTIANVALPRMQGTMSASQDQMTWVLTAYIVAAAIMTPLSGWLADQFGRKRLFLLSIVGFTITSALCGMADSLTQIVVFRLLQGVCGAALVPISQAILFDVYPPSQHARAMSIWGLGVVIGPMLGPILGGYLTDNYSWRWVFYINVPLGILASLGVVTFFRSSTRSRSPFDFFGFATISIAVGALQMLLDRGPLKDWFGSTEIRIEAGLMVFTLYLFMVHSLTAANPFIRISMFRDRNFASGNVFMFVVGVVMYATLALLPAMLQDLMGYSVFEAGLVTSPRSVGSVVAMLVIARLMGWIDRRVLISGGFLLAALSLWDMAHFTTTMSMSKVVWAGLWQGLGVAISYVPLTALSFATLPSALRNQGTAMFNLIRNIGSSIGISMVQALLVRNTQIQHAVLAANLTPYRIATLHSSLTYAPYAHATLPALNAEVTAQANMVAYIDDYYLMFILILLVTPVMLLVRKAAPRPSQDAAPVIEAIE